MKGQKPLEMGLLVGNWLLWMHEYMWPAGSPTATDPFRAVLLLLTFCHNRK